MSKCKAIFHRRFEFDRRPIEGVTFVVSPSKKPQLYPRDVVEAAIAAGAATAYNAKDQETNDGTRDN